MKIFKSLQTEEDSAQVKLPPPLILFLCMLGGYLAHRVYPRALVEPSAMVGDTSGSVVAVGSTFVSFAIGLGLIAHCLMRFKRAKTAVEPWRSTSQIITTGVYSVSRNPIYLSLLLLGIGMAAGVNSLWMALGLLPFVLILHFMVIKREEAYLEAKFGDAYRAYKRRVRRWL